MHDANIDRETPSNTISQLEAEIRQRNKVPDDSE
jgi:hypothetical protein